MKQGVTLLMNVHGADWDILTSELYIKTYFTKLIKAVDLTPVPESFTARFFPSPDKMNYGVTAFMVLLESHIAIHTWPELRYARIELSSCKDFDWQKAVEITQAFTGGIVRAKMMSWNNMDEEQRE